MCVQFMITEDKFFIGGQWSKPARSATGVLKVISPITEGVFGRVAESTPANIDRAVAAARDALIFGRVLAVIRYGTPDEAIKIANDSAYGLGGGVFTADIERGLAVAAQLHTGSCVIHDGLQGGGGGPFGGYKQSGIGPEFGPEGLASRYQMKSISLPPGANSE
jgi:acyl-CoA reductase-like NAD-dependent aldehyde dehydrogenase